MTGPAVVDALALVLLGLALLGVATRGLVASVRILAVQSATLALVAATVALDSGAPHMWAAFALTVAVRTIAVPTVLLRVLRAVELRRETRPLLSTRSALLVSIGLALVAFLVAGRLHLPGAFPSQHALAVSLALMLVGLLLMITRRKAISQVIGLITIENGIFLAGLIATLGLPLFVEIGVFLDLLVGVAVMAVFTLRINERFDTLNTDLLRQLRG